jgi:hypothetical protein
MQNAVMADDQQHEVVLKRKFAGLTHAEIEKKQDNLQNKRTKRQEKSAADQFEAFLRFQGEKDLNFYAFDAKKLDASLSSFWFNIRTSTGDFYKVKSLECIRYSLNRDLKAHGCNFDITSKASVDFQKSLKAFEDAKRELKREGKGQVTHLGEISPEGEQTFYRYNAH